MSADNVKDRIGEMRALSTDERVPHHGMCDAVALLIRQHWYDHEDETCGCISTSDVDMLHLSIVEHSIHLSRLILARLGVSA